MTLMLRLIPVNYLAKLLLLKPESELLCLNFCDVGLLVTLISNLVSC